MDDLEPILEAIAQQGFREMGVSAHWEVSEVAAVPDMVGVVHLVLTRHGRPATSTPAFTGTELGDENALLAFVEQLQDAVLEEEGGAALPVCPGHPHPQVPSIESRTLVWRCPEEARRR
ncbi:hypothetical protein [Desertihabitans aurantiacus]|uniref:hypothetical protein n=1 Tax=Desertihabitans aurantiacus TaxID=2282477 RepID=UPI000DF83E6D|nr:hypothetical protein [Desertihabitans aurantiacus]